MLILFVSIINAHKWVTDHEILSPTLNCPILNRTAIAIVAIHSGGIATASHMLWTCTFQ